MRRPGLLLRSPTRPWPVLLRAADPDTHVVYLRLQVGESIVAEREMRGSDADRRDLSLAQTHLDAHHRLTSLVTPGAEPSDAAKAHFREACVAVFGERVRRWFP